MTHPFLQALKERPLLTDGAMAACCTRVCSARGEFRTAEPDQTDMVQQVHIDYINAGADLIETNSFAGNRTRLTQYGLDNDVWKLNVWLLSGTERPRSSWSTSLCCRCDRTDG